MGRSSIKEAARAVSERDDRLLAEKMEKLQKAQEENSDSDSEDETMGDVDIEKRTGAHHVDRRRARRCGGCRLNRVASNGNTMAAWTDDTD